MDLINVSYNLGDPGADNKQMFVFQAPTDGLGGGCRLLSAKAVNNAATSGGTTFTLQLLKYSSAGTPAVNGTISAATYGGTTAYWADSVPQAFTLDADYTFLDAGEWLVVDYQEENSGSPDTASIVCLFQVGK